MTLSINFVKKIVHDIKTKKKKKKKLQDDLLNVAGNWIWVDDQQVPDFPILNEHELKLLTLCTY